MSLQPCRFFAQGNCRYGNNCRFYHGQVGGGGGTTFYGNRTLAPVTFQPQQQQQQGALNLSAKSNSNNLDIIVETVKKDMLEWQNSGIWAWSCYGPIGGKPGIPGFEDLSPEEYRYNYYAAGGNVPPQIPLHMQNTYQLRMNYQGYSQENRNILERIATTTTNVATSSVLAPQQGTGIFGGGTQPSAGIFGGNATTQQNKVAGSIFGGGAVTQQNTSTSSIFGGSGATSGVGVFASQQQQQAPVSNIFGGGAVFGAQSTTATPSLFGQPVATAAGSVGGGLFQSQQPVQKPSLFGVSAFGQPATTAPSGGGLFQTPQQQSIFSQNQTTQQQLQQTTTTPSVFQPPSGTFQQQQNNQPPSGLFQQAPQHVQPASQQSSLFGGGSVFGGGQPQQPQPAYSTPSIFGGPTAGNSPLMQSGSQPPPQAAAPVMSVASQQKGVYTDESELTAEELDAFKANEFTLENIPTKPPPQALCF